MKKRHKSILVMVGFCIALYAIVAFNRYVSQQINDLTVVPSQEAESVHENKVDQESPPRISQRKVLRIERRSSDSDYTESIVLDNKREIARFKTKRDKIFDELGHIPDGKVKFVNEWKKTFGFEHYRNGKRDGVYREHYNNGNIEVEAEYQRGRLLKRKTYYYTKVLMKEEDFSATQFVSRLHSYGKFDKIGKGKFYRQDGSLKLEWSFADDSKQYYTKRYNEEGELTEAQYYDNQGELVEDWTAQQEVHLNAAEMEPSRGLNQGPEFNLNSDLD